MSKKSQKSGQQQDQRNQTDGVRRSKQTREQQQQQQPLKLAHNQCDSAGATKQVRANENNTKLNHLNHHHQQQKQQHQQQQTHQEAHKERNRRPARVSATSEPSEQGQNGRPEMLTAGFAAGPARLSNEANICAACQKPIKERYLLMALDKHWHEDCLKCACCDCRLGEVGSSLFTHSDKLLCRRDFLRIFGQQGHCAACNRPIPPYELVMKAQDKAYHMDCFACQRCQYRFCVGDRFHLTEAHKIICLVCYSEQPQPQPQPQLHQHQQQQPQQQQLHQLERVSAHSEEDGEPPVNLMSEASELDEPGAAIEGQEEDARNNEQHEQADESSNLAQLETVDGRKQALDATLGQSCPAQQIRFPSQQEQESACVM